MKRYSDVKNVNELPNRDSVQKTKKDKMILDRVFEKNPRLLSHGDQVVLRKKSLNISCNTIKRRLAAHEVKFHSTVKKPLLPKKHIKKRFIWAKENLDSDGTR